MRWLLTNKLLCIYFVSSLSLSLANHSVKGNTATSPWFHSMEFAAHQGYILVHTPSIAHLKNNNLHLFHVSLSHQTHGNKEWHHQYNFPELGLGLLFGEMGNRDVLGHTIALAPYINIPLYKGTNMDVLIRHDLGLAFLTKCFHPSFNQDNNAIGSHVNISVSSQINARFRLGTNSSLSAGFGMVHFSNGAIRKPNLGINIPVAMISYKQNIYPLPENTQPPTQTNRTGQTFLSFSLAGGISRINPINNNTYPAFSMATTLSRAISVKRNIGLGADLFLNYADKQTMRVKDGRNIALAEILKPGIHFSYEQAFGSMDFIFQNGVYLLEKHRRKDKLYTRVGLRYHTSQNLILHLCLNANQITASFIEFGMGFRMK